MRLYIILRIEPETLQKKKKKLHQFKTLYFFQRPWAFNYKQKGRNLVVLCTINKSGYMCKKAISSACTKSGSFLNYVTIRTIEGNIASGQLTFGTFLSMSAIGNLTLGNPRAQKWLKQ